MVINHENYRKIYDLYFHPICRFLNYYTHDHYVIEDIVQTVFMRLWEESRHKEILYVRTYLFRSARNIVLNYLRDQQTRNIKLQRWAEVELENMDHRECIDREHFLRVLEEAVCLLPPKCREIFEMHQESLTYKQIAERKDISIKTVENQLHIAFHKIHLFFDKLPEDKLSEWLLIFILLTEIE